MNIDLTGMHMAENRKKLKMTVLHRPGGVWYQTEINRLAGGLMTEVTRLDSEGLPFNPGFI